MKKRSPNQQSLFFANRAKKRGPKHFTVGPQPITQEEIAQALRQLPAQKAAYLSSEDQPVHASPNFDDPLFERAPPSPYEVEAWKTYSAFRREQKDIENLRIQDLLKHTQELAHRRSQRALNPPKQGTSPRSSEVGKDFLLTSSRETLSPSEGVDVQGGPTAGSQNGKPGRYKHPPDAGGDGGTLKPTPEGDGTDGGWYSRGSREGGTIQAAPAAAASPPGVAGAGRKGRQQQELRKRKISQGDRATSPMSIRWGGPTYRGWRGALRTIAAWHAARITGRPIVEIAKLSRVELVELIASLPYGYPGRAAMRAWLRHAPPSTAAFCRLDGPDGPVHFLRFHQDARRAGLSMALVRPIPRRYRTRARKASPH